MTDTCCAQGRALSRRGFLQALGVTAGAVALSGVSVRTAYGAVTDGNVLVVLSLRGGVDGLSLVAPVGDADYARLRPSIAIPTDTGIPTGDRMFALHPALAPLQPLWTSGQLGAVHAVGSPDGSRSHFAATEELERAAPGTTIRTGWLDRVLGLTGTGAVFQAARLGSGTPGKLLAGPSPEFATRALSRFTLAGSDWVGPRMATALAALHTGVDSPQVPAARATLEAVSTAATITKADTTPQGGAVYPKTPLGAALADVARLVRSGQGLQAACVDLGDWDMHNGLGKAGTGWMANKCKELAECLVAFAADLGTDLSRVTVVTMSEFGRRAKENASGGVDHGFGNAMLLLGGGVAGGKVHGRWPGLSAAALDHGDLAGTTDFRSVIGELLVRRAGVPEGELSKVFPGFRPEFLGAVRA